MSRGHGPDEYLNPREVAETSADPRRPGNSSPSREQGQGTTTQEDARLGPGRAAESTQARPNDQREKYEVRGKTYWLRSSEIDTLTEIGKFRAVASKDLEEFAYHGDKDHTGTEVQNLIRQGLVAVKEIPHPEISPRRLLTLTKRGHLVLTATKSVPKNQAIYHGFTKPREAHHDADLYRLYYTAADNIEGQGGRNLRVMLDYELKKRVYHDLARLGPHRESTAKKKEIAERHGLQLVRGKIPLPDLRIEYETRDGEMARVDLELATEHYRGRNLADKVRAGFSIYAAAQDAAGLRRVLDQRELTAEIFSL
ncbi:MAG: hypothetical protein LAN84_01135 [Acidobacteriia bacterium]|nr:hypothetical protein [Terriglobia bacterium]